MEFSILHLNVWLTMKTSTVNISRSWQPLTTKLSDNQQLVYLVMISVISIMALFSMFIFKVISHMDFCQKSIQIPTVIHQSNQFQHINPIKAYKKQLNKPPQLSQTSIVCYTWYICIYMSILMSISIKKHIKINRKNQPK